MSNDNLKERLTDMSVLASTRTPADALKYIEELEDKLSESEALLAKAMEALEKVAQYDMQYLAINTLAELSSVSCANLKGEK